MAGSTAGADIHRCYHRAILNICMPYAARDDIATAVESAVRLAVEKGGHR